MKQIPPMLHFQIIGRTPSKKNNKQIIYVRGTPLIISSKDHMKWHRDAIKQLGSVQNCPVRIEKVRSVHLSFWGENKRKFDLSNKAESVMDLLVDAKILVDDNYEVVPELCLSYGGVDKNNPRCEITIYII